MNVPRAGSITGKDGTAAAYTHNAVAPVFGKIGVRVGIESTGDKGKLAELGKQIAMHIAATSPLATRREEVDPAVVERERAVLIAEAKESGRPDNIIEKMVEGRIRKFYEEVVLLSQIGRAHV